MKADDIIAGTGAAKGVVEFAGGLVKLFKDVRSSRTEPAWDNREQHRDEGSHRNRRPDREPNYETRLGPPRERRLASERYPDPPRYGQRRPGYGNTHRSYDQSVRGFSDRPSHDNRYGNNNFYYAPTYNFYAGDSRSYADSARSYNSSSRHHAARDRYDDYRAQDRLPRSRTERFIEVEVEEVDEDEEDEYDSGDERRKARRWAMERRGTW